MQTPAPFFSNDLLGFTKVVVTVLVPLFGLVIWFLRYGPTETLKDFRRELNGYGERVNRTEKEAAADRQETGQLVIRMTRSEQDRERIRTDMVRVETRVSENEKRIEKNQQAILDAAHKIELQVASLASQASVGKELRDGLDRIADIMIQRDNRERSIRGERREVE